MKYSRFNIPSAAKPTFDYLSPYPCFLSPCVEAFRNTINRQYAILACVSVLIFVRFPLAIVLLVIPAVVNPLNCQCFGLFTHIGEEVRELHKSVWESLASRLLQQTVFAFMDTPFALFGQSL